MRWKRKSRNNMMRCYFYQLKKIESIRNNFIFFYPVSLTSNSHFDIHIINNGQFRIWKKTSPLKKFSRVKIKQILIITKLSLKATNYSCLIHHILLEVFNLCHQYRARQAYFISVQSDQDLYCWLTDFKISSWNP